MSLGRVELRSTNNDALINLPEDLKALHRSKKQRTAYNACRTQNVVDEKTRGPIALSPTVVQRNPLKQRNVPCNGTRWCLALSLRSGGERKGLRQSGTGFRGAEKCENGELDDGFGAPDEGPLGGPLGVGLRARAIVLVGLASGVSA